jgi:tetratricopeptide (TPR) repeat protein
VHGTYNVLCYAIVFFLIILNLHTTQQLEQLITVALLASLPVALYGVLQHSGFELIFPGYDYSQRVISTMGNPIFLGAYLIMVIPLAFGRLLVSLRALLGRGQLALSRRSTLLEVLGYSSLLVLQLVCLLYSNSRGPWFGLLAGVLFFAVTIALRHRMIWLLFVTIVAGAALIALLVALNLPNVSVEPFTESHYLSRLTFSDELAEGTGTEWVRLYIWQGILELIRSNPNIGFTPDLLRPIRLLIGYGPEAMKFVFPQVYPPGLAYIESREAMADRAHNELLDLLVTTGVLGLLAFLILVGSFFYCGVHLLWRTRSFKTQISLIALLSAVFAHLIEAQFGILLPSAELLLWLYLALVSVMYVHGTATTKEGKVDPASSTAVEASTNVTTQAVIASRSPGRGEGAATQSPSRKEEIASSQKPVLSEAEGTLLAMTRAEQPHANDANRLKSILSLLVVCVIPFFASFSSINLLLADVYLVKGMQFQNSGQWKESIIAYDQAIQAFPNESKFYAFKAGAYFELAQSIPDDELETRGKLLQASVDAMAKARELEPLDPEYYADAGKIYGYWARTVDPNKLDQAAEFYELALQLSPHRAIYRNELGRFYFDAGRYEEAVQQLQLSLEIDPEFYATHYNLGLVYLELGEKDRAKEHFETALLLHPECGECTQKLESLEGN